MSDGKPIPPTMLEAVDQTHDDDVARFEDGDRDALANERPPADVAAQERDPAAAAAKETNVDDNQTVQLDEEELRKRLTPQQYDILRRKGTEPPFTGAYVDQETPGLYRCAACDAPVFSSETKFHSGSGWPSFEDPIATTAVKETTDRSHGMVRTEVTCARCGSHLGHVFPDGPGDSGQRYCINSAALEFEPERDV